jgi:hypothetical protein
MAESDEFYQDEETDHLDPNIRAELRKSKERAKEAEQAKAELADLKRELAFTKAGIPEDGVGKLFRKAYDGDTDAESIRQSAAEYGLGSQAEQSSEINEVQEELERHRNIAGATGSNASGPTAEQEFLAALQGANNVDEVNAIINSHGMEAGGLHMPGMR